MRVNSESNGEEGPTMSEDADVFDSDEAEKDSADTGAEGDEGSDKKKLPPRQVSISLRSLVLAAAVVIMVGAIGVLAWLYIGAESRLDTLTRQAENNAKAEQVALDYAVNAAAMDFKDMDAWKAKLVAGTSPELKERLAEAATSMEQLLVPLEWSSTAEPLVAKVRSDTAGTYVVDAFVSVLTKTTQAPEGLQSTATYSLTIDSNNDWQITDVAGIAAVMQPE